MIEWIWRRFQKLVEENFQSDLTGHWWDCSDSVGNVRLALFRVLGAGVTSGKRKPILSSLDLCSFLPPRGKRIIQRLVSGLALGVIIIERWGARALNDLLLKTTQTSLMIFGTRSKTLP